METRCRDEIWRHRGREFARRPVPEAVRRLARLQSGVLTREQALGCGLSDAAIRRLMAAGWWTRIAAGVYLTAPVDLDWEALAWAGVLIGGDHARLGGLAAAHLHGLREAQPEVIEVLVPAAGARPRQRGVWEFHRERPGARSARTTGDPPRITIEDAALDLYADCTREEAVGWLTSALNNRTTTTDELRRALQSRHFVPQRALLTE